MKPKSSRLPRVATTVDGESLQARRLSTLDALQRALQRADAGALARLRRSDPKAPPPDFFRISVDVLDEMLPERGERRDREESRWAVLVQVIAMALGADPESGGLLRGGASFGQALARADVAERRVLRLLEAEDEQLADLVRHVVHGLVSKGQSFTPISLAALILDRDPDARERVRREIARDFYRSIDGN